jgi:hypothetical protein
VFVSLVFSVRYQLGLLRVYFEPKINSFSCILPKNLKTQKENKIKKITTLKNYHMQVKGLLQHSALVTRFKTLHKQQNQLNTKNNHVQPFQTSVIGHGRLHQMTIIALMQKIKIKIKTTVVLILKISHKRHY